MPRGWHGCAPPWPGPESPTATSRRSSLALEAVYRNDVYQPRADLTGYRASNGSDHPLPRRLRPGRVIDALVAEGVNEISGPILGFENLEAALDEAGALAIAAARARAGLYARGARHAGEARGLRDRRRSSTGNYVGRDDGNSLMNSLPDAGAVSSTIDPGGRRISATVSVVFELE